MRGPGGGSAKANPFNQTIIINNPNININYLPEARPDRNAPLSSRGLDNWHLNNNLKEVLLSPRSSRKRANSDFSSPNLTPIATSPTVPTSSTKLGRRISAASIRYTPRPRTPLKTP